MDQTVFNRIKKLLDGSALLSNVKSIPKFDADYNFSNETILITGAVGSLQNHWQWSYKTVIKLLVQASHFT